MNELDKLINRQLKERTQLDNKHEKERSILIAKHVQERFSQLDNDGLATKQEQELNELKKQQSLEGQQMFDRHLKEDAELRDLQAKIKPVKNFEAQQEIKALNVQYAEEKEKTRQNAEGYEKDRQNLVEKIKERFAKNRDKERDY